MRILYPIGASLFLVMLLQISPITSKHYDDLEPVDENLYRYDDDWLDYDEEMTDQDGDDEHLVKRGEEGPCPESYPYAYAGGAYCCMYAYEKDSGKGKESCDGGPISLESTCCANSKNKKCSYSVCTTLESSDETKALLEELKQQVVSRTEGLTTLAKLKRYLESNESLEVFQYQFLNKLVSRGKNFSLDDTVSWIFNNRTMMEKLMTSGDVPSNEYGKAISILAEIIKQDPDAMDGWKLNLAVGIAIAFTRDIKSWAYGYKFDSIERYHTYARWGGENIYFDLFYTLNAWEMRYLASSKITDEEMIWARENVPDGNKNPWNVAGSTFKMVKYTMYNDEGVSIQSKNFYKGLPRTMEVLHQYGAVCGGISKFGTGMANAFGIPAFVMGQPGHCAFLWLRNGTRWSIGNNVGGWGKARVGVPYTWKKAAAFFPLMHEAQKTPDAYRLSEKMRIMAEFVDSTMKYEVLDDALTVCPHNYDIYMDLKETMSQNRVDESYVEKQMVPYLENYYGGIFGVETDVALHKTATASEDTPSKLFDQNAGTVWKCTAETAWVEIDLGNPCVIKSMEMRWWGLAKSADYDILAQIDGVFHTVLTRSDESRKGKKNAIGNLPGWDGKTTKIRFELRQGNTGKAITFALKDIIITGVEYISTEKISLGRPVKTDPDDSTGERLVDGDLETYWTSNLEYSWIVIKFRGLCAVESVLIDWVDDIQGLQTVQYLVGEDIVHDSSEAGAYDRIELTGFGGSLKIKLGGANFYSIREVTAFGACFSTKILSKERLSSTMTVPDAKASSFLLNDIGSIIDEYECGSCW